MKKGIIWSVTAVWILTILLGTAMVIRERVPQYTEESQTAGKYVLSKELQPGDVVEQSFLPTQDWLESVSVAIDYTDQVDKENTKVLVEVLQGDAVLQSQELAVWVFDKLTFLRFSVACSANSEEKVTIRITNTSLPIGNGTSETIQDAPTAETNVFAMMTTDLDYLYLGNAQNYTHNGVAQNGRLFTNATYRVGYDYYPALTWLFWLIGGAAVVSGLLLKKQRH
ncbi:MAG: hypothetical protein IJB84_01290 [Lachnospiraceae bacterium]|nr:hypothetical protein [Lachnospiraceae bacterium]